MLRTWLDTILLMPEAMFWATTLRLALLTAAVVFLAQRQKQHQVAGVAFFLGATATMASLAISLLMTWSAWAVTPVGVMLLLSWVPVTSLVVTRLTMRWYHGLPGFRLTSWLATPLGASLATGAADDRGPGGPSITS